MILRESVIFILTFMIINLTCSPISQQTFKIKLYKNGYTEETFPSVKAMSSVQFFPKNGSLNGSNVCVYGGSSTYLTLRNISSDKVSNTSAITTEGQYACIATYRSNKKLWHDPACSVMSQTFTVKRLESQPDIVLNYTTFTHFWLECLINAAENRSQYQWNNSLQEDEGQTYQDFQGRLHFYVVKPITARNFSCSFLHIKHNTILTVVNNVFRVYDDNVTKDDSNQTTTTDPMINGTAADSRNTSNFTTEMSINATKDDFTFTNVMTTQPGVLPSDYEVEESENQTTPSPTTGSTPHRRVRVKRSVDDISKSPESLPPKTEDYITTTSSAHFQSSTDGGLLWLFKNVVHKVIQKAMFSNSTESTDFTTGDPINSTATEMNSTTTSSSLYELANLNTSLSYSDPLESIDSTEEMDPTTTSPQLNDSMSSRFRREAVTSASTGLTTGITTLPNTSLSTALMEPTTMLHNLTRSTNRPAIALDPCMSEPCQNGAMCKIKVDSPHTFVCICQPSFGGVLCKDKKVDNFVYAIERSVRVMEGEQAVLECFVSSDCHVEWSAGSMKHNVRWEEIGSNKNRLKIKRTKESDSRVYTCDCGEMGSASISLKVIKTPAYSTTIQPRDGVFLVDRPLKYTCNSDAPIYELTYYKNAKLLSSYEFTSGGNTNSLIEIVDKKADMRGCVQCEFIINNQTIFEQSCFLIVSKVNIFERPDKLIYISPGSDLNLTIKAQTVPQTPINYTFIGGPLPPNATEDFTGNVYRLSILNISAERLHEYERNYTFRVTGEYQRNESIKIQVEVKVRKLPSLIGYHEAETGNGSAWFAVIPVIVIITLVLCIVKSKFGWIKRKLEDRKVKRMVSKEFLNLSSVDRYCKMPILQEGFPRQRLRILECLGEGNFGKVVKAEALDITGTGVWETVAIKMCKETATDLQKEEFTHELSLVKRIPKHPNIVSYLGFCKSTDQPTFIILEYVAGGNLLQFLRDRRPGSGQKNREQEVNSSELSSFAHQIAKGLCHLSSHNIIHRDIAARNILVSENNVCKVADLGLARDLYESNVYEIASKGGLPIRWMAPESLTDGVYTTQSDVWSYGVLLWEIITLGASPYPGLSARQVMATVVSGNKLECPEFCSQDIKELMMQCWEMSPEKRPTFIQICEILENLLEEQTDYLNLQNYEEGIYSVMYPTDYDEKL